MPSRELTCRTLGKGKSCSKVFWDGICDRSQEGKPALHLLLANPTPVLFANFWRSPTLKPGKQGVDAEAQQVPSQFSFWVMSKSQ